MNAVLAAEVRKQRSTRIDVVLLLTALVFALLVVLLHALSLPLDRLATVPNQMNVFGWGVLGALFAGMAGAMTITAEYRYGTIRPTLLVTPRRDQVLTAKLATSAATGAVLACAVEALVLPVGAAALTARDVQIALAHPDVVRLLLGAALTGALWGAIGLGVGAAVRSQVTTLVGFAVWLLFVENLLIGFVPEAGQFAPGQAGFAVMGQETEPGLLLPPLAGALVLVAWAAVAVAAGRVATVRRDVS